jgi:hypothetical protein
MQREIVVRGGSVRLQRQSPPERGRRQWTGREEDYQAARLRARICVLLHDPLRTAPVAEEGGHRRALL